MAVGAIGAAAGAELNSGSVAAEERSIGITSPVAREAVNAAIASSVTQSASAALGVQSGFNWDAVAASAVAAPIADEAGDEVDGYVGSELNAPAGRFAQTFTAGLINQVAYASFTGGKLNYAEIVTDDFGNAIGDSIVQAEAGSPYGLTQAQQQQEYSDISASTSAALAQENAQIAAAAGRSLLAQNAPLTDNEKLPEPDVQLQNITVNLNAVQRPYIVQSGDVLSTIVGTSDPAVIGEVIRDNNLTSSKIYPGELLYLPDGNIQPGDQASGQAVLNADNARQLAELQPVSVSVSLLTGPLHAPADFEVPSAQSPAPADSLTPGEISNQNAESLLAFSPYPQFEAAA